MVVSLFCFVVIVYPIFLTEALIKLAEKDAFKEKVIRCTASLVVTNNGPEGTHILQIYWIKKDAIKFLDGRSVLDKPFFKTNLKYKECFISWCWSHTLWIILRGLTALQNQTSGLL